MTAAPDSGGGSGPRPHWRARLLWFVALWVAGLAVVAGVAYLIRALVPG